MEIPICVTDAHTFTDHIHEIKSWIYRDQVRLIVPSSLPENVEVLYQKSLEPKTASKEAPKSKVLGKPTKKEYPTFDANPKVAKAFLARLQAGKDYETGAHGRPIYEDEEKHAAVHFASASEQYSAWKDVEDYEEKPDVPAGAESWADKLRRKQAVANGNTENKTKGPVKPKLVAKTGADNSPWKVQKNAPSISGVDVPVSLRPMMSCSLWRIHESIHRNDENQVFVLTSQSSVRDVAQKLNITVRSTFDFADQIRASKTQNDLNTFGGVEKEFGVRPVKERRAIRCTAVKGSIAAMTNGTMQQNGGKGEGSTIEKNNHDAVGLDRTSAAQALKSLSPSDNQVEEVAEKGSLPIQEIHIRGGSSLVADKLLDADKQPLTGLIQKVDKEAVSSPNPDSISQAPFTAIADNVMHRSAPAVASSEVDRGRLPETANKPSGTPSPEEVRPSQSSGNIWSRSFAEALSGQARKASPISQQKIASAPEPTERPPKPQTPARDLPASECHANAPKGSIKIEGPTIGPTQHAPSSLVDTQDSSLDSDEEIVVFQPKRLSAQKKPAQQTSRPTTPNVQPQPAPSTAPPPTSSQSAPLSHAKKQVTPKIAHKQRTPHKIVNGVGGAHSAKIKPPVIDPDAFGRGFAVNKNPNKGSLRGNRPHHSPQPSLFDTSMNTSRPNSSHRQHRKSPSRPSPKVSPTKAISSVQQQSTPPTSAPRLPSSAQDNLMPIGSGRPFASPLDVSPPQPPQAVPSYSPFSPPLQAATLNANAPVFQPGGTGSSLLQSPFQQELSTPKSTTVQPPIGSGRPSSKVSQQNTPEPAKPPLKMTVKMPQVEATNALRERAPPPPTGPRQTDSTFTGRSNGPQNGHLRAVNPGLSRQGQRPFDGRKSNGPPNHMNGDFAPRGRGRGGLNMRPPVKPSLFEPELDHTRAYQPETVEPNKSAVPEVQYVLKSGSTREQTRGKGKLWVG